MYIFELIARALKKKNTTFSNNFNSTEDLNPDTNEEDCEHLFLPLDSSNEYFACKYCGLVVSREKLKNNQN